MESATKEVETKQGAIKAEHDDDDKPQGILQDVNKAETPPQAATSIQATGTAPVTSSPTPEEEDIEPPTLEEMTAYPRKYREYVQHLFNKTPPAPSGLLEADADKWRYYHTLTATLDHLCEVFGYQNRAWEFYKDWLVDNNIDYHTSPFKSYKTAKGLFDEKRKGEAACSEMTAGNYVAPQVGRKKKKASES